MGVRVGQPKGDETLTGSKRLEETIDLESK